MKGTESLGLNDGPSTAWNSRMPLSSCPILSCRNLELEFSNCGGLISRTPKLSPREKELLHAIIDYRGEETYSIYTNQDESKSRR